MNKKGFTIIELVTSLTLATVIMIFLFNIVFILKDMYVSSERKHTLLIEQAALSEEINTFLYNIRIESISSCSDYCMDIKTENGTKKLNVTIDPANKNSKIQFGNYLYKLNETEIIDKANTTMCVKKYSSSDARGINRLLIIDVPINSKLVKNNFGLKIAIPYSSLTTNDASAKFCS